MNRSLLIALLLLCINPNVISQSIETDKSDLIDRTTPEYLWEQQLRERDMNSRYMHVMEYHEEWQETIVWGGFGFYTTNTTWAWGDDGWRVVTHDSPPVRARCSMAYSSDENQMVLFGGYNSPNGFKIPSDETWILNDEGWSRLLISGPEPRYFHNIVYDKNRREIILFGGYDEFTRFGDTWSFSDGEWNIVSTDDGPLPRSGHSMVYDSKREVAVLFGGYDGFRNPYGDIWEWDGFDWTEIPQPIYSPGTLYDHTAVYNSRSKSMIVFGGYVGTSGEHNADVWIWKNSKWTKPNIGLVGVNPPLPRSALGMTYDSSRDLILIHAGAWNAVGDLPDTWTLKKFPR